MLIISSYNNFHTLNKSYRGTTKPNIAKNTDTTDVKSKQGYKSIYNQPIDFKGIFQPKQDDGAIKGKNCYKEARSCTPVK